MGKQKGQDRQGTRVERRARQTRTLLQQALWELLQQQRFEGITIQDIAELADVNRSTFYAYFPDKYALLESALRERFRQALVDRFPATDGRWDAASVRILIRSSYEFLTEVQRLSTPSTRIWSCSSGSWCRANSPPSSRRGSDKPRDRKHLHGYA